jgi:hypothetical protein
MRRWITIKKWTLQFSNLTLRQAPHSPLYPPQSRTSLWSRPTNPQWMRLPSIRISRASIRAYMFSTSPNRPRISPNAKILHENYSGPTNKRLRQKAKNCPKWGKSPANLIFSTKEPVSAKWANTSRSSTRYTRTTRNLTEVLSKYLPK